MLKITQQIQATFEKLDFLFRPYMKYFQLNVNLFLYHHGLKPHTCFFRSSSKTQKTLYLTSGYRRKAGILVLVWMFNLNSTYSLFNQSWRTTLNYIISPFTRFLSVKYLKYLNSNVLNLHHPCTIITRELWNRKTTLRII